MKSCEYPATAMTMLMVVILPFAGACNGGGGHDAGEDTGNDPDGADDEGSIDPAAEDMPADEISPEAEIPDTAEDFSEPPDDIADDSGEEAGPSCGADAVNVTDRGVTGDGETDDTAAIQALFDDESLDSIYFPAGTYMIGLQSGCGACALRIERDGLTVCGEGAASILKLSDPGSDSRTVRAINVTGDDVSLVDFTLDGSRIPGTGWEYEQEHGVFVLDDAARFHARGLEIHHFQGDGIFLYRAQDAVVHENYAHDCWRAALNLEVGTGTDCHDNRVERCNSGVHIEMDTDGTVNADTWIHHNTIAPLQPDTESGGTGIVLNGRADGLLRTVVEFNTIDQTGDPAPYSAIICATTSGAILRSNTIIGSVDSQHGILTAWYGNTGMTIEGNVLEDCTYNAPVLCGGATVATPNDGITVHDNVARSSCTWTGIPYGDSFDGGFVWVVGAAPTTNLDAHDNVFE